MFAFLFRLASGRLAFLGLSVLQRGIPFLLLPLMTGTLGAYSYGQASVLTAIFLLCGVTFSLGMDMVTYRHGPAALVAAGEDRDTLSAGAALQLCAPIVLAAGTAGVILMAGLPIASVPAQSIALSVMGAGVTTAAWQFPAAWARTQGKFGRYATFAIVNTVILASCKVVFVVLLGWGAEGWAIADLVSGILLIFVTGASYRVPLSWRKGVRTRGLRPALRLGLPLVPGQASQWAQGMSDRLLIAGLLGASLAGQYALAGQLVSIGSAVILELSKYVLPSLASAGYSNRDAVNMVLQRVAPSQLQLFSLTAVGVGLGGSFAPVVFGASFSQSAPISTFLAAALLLTGVGYLSDNILGITLGLTRIVGVANVAGAVASVTANILLIPVLGVAGAVGVAICSSAVVTACLWFALWKNGARISPLFPSASIVMTSLGAILAMGCVVLFADAALWNIPIACAPLAHVLIVRIRHRRAHPSTVLVGIREAERDSEPSL